MRLCIFISRPSHRSDGLRLLILRLLARPFSYWWRGVCSSLLCPAKTATVVFTPIIIYFYKVWLNTLDICFSWLLSHIWYGHLLKGSAPILRIIFSLDVSNVFWRSPRSGQQILSISSAQAGVSITSYLFVDIRYWNTHRGTMYWCKTIFKESWGLVTFKI